MVQPAKKGLMRRLEPEEPVRRVPVPAATAVYLPTAGALKWYGLTEEEWRSILSRQGGVCAICKRVPRSGQLAIDHEHVKGWKKMKPADKKKYVRGLCCFLCNGKCVSKWTTLERALAVVEYLHAYQSRGGGT